MSDTDFPGWHGTTIVAVRKGGTVVVAGDGQVSLGQTVIKGTARKVRRLAPGGYEVVAGFAGSTADAFARCMVEDVQRAVDAGVGGVIMEVPASPHLIQYGYKWDLERAIDLSIESTKFAHDNGLEVVFFPIDFTRSDLKWVIDLIDRVGKEGHMDGLALVDEGLAHGAATGVLGAEAELLRLQALLLLRQSHKGTDAVEAAFVAALDSARRSGAGLHDLRVSVSFAGYLFQSGRLREAAGRLDKGLAAVDPGGPPVADVKSAQALRRRLSLG